MPRLRRPNHYERLLYRTASGRDAPFCLIVRWPLWWSRFRGLALGWLVLVEDDSDPLLVCHEIVHVAQFKADPLRFWFRYFRELARVGYTNNRYERQARAIERRAWRLMLHPEANVDFLRR